MWCWKIWKWPSQNPTSPNKNTGIKNRNSSSRFYKENWWATTANRRIDLEKKLNPKALVVQFIADLKFALFYNINDWSPKFLSPNKKYLISMSMANFSNFRGTRLFLAFEIHSRPYKHCEYLKKSVEPITYFGRKNNKDSNRTSEKSVSK